MQEHGIGVLPFFSFSNDHRTCFAGSLVGHGCVIPSGGLLFVPFFSLNLFVSLCLPLFLFLLVFFFFPKLRLITVVSIIDSSKRVITNSDCHSLSRNIICIVVIERLQSIGSIAFKLVIKLHLSLEFI